MRKPAHQLGAVSCILMVVLAKKALELPDSKGKMYIFSLQPTAEVMSFPTPLKLLQKPSTRQVIQRRRLLEPIHLFRPFLPRNPDFRCNRSALRQSNQHPRKRQGSLEGPMNRKYGCKWKRNGTFRPRT